MRKIIHIDCDCFYAAVEMRDNPELRSVPLAIGGSSARRGVLATCNYEARQYGLHSAMPTKEALRLCPDLVLMPARFDAYKEASMQVRDIFYRFTELVEPLSLDEAYLDVSACDAFGGIATDIAREICALIEKEVGITASAGIAENKFLAKVASDWKKPSGITVIKPSQVERFIKQLPVKKIPGVGKAAMKKMQALSIEIGEDLQQVELSVLLQHFGVFGKRLFDLAKGIDHREVSNQRVRKSVSIEHTFVEDIKGLDELYEILEKNYQEFLVRLDKAKADLLIHKCFVKIRFSDFSVTTKEMTASEPDIQLFKTLCAVAFSRKGLPVRLLGLGVGLKPAENSSQLTLFE